MKNFLKGLVVGLGGVSPGLSGSVLLVIFGLYRRTIDGISTVIRAFFRMFAKESRKKAFEELKANLLFLVPLAVGMGGGILLFSKIVDYLLETFPAYTRFAFLGLILGTLPLFFREVKKEGFKPIYYLVMLVSCVCGFLVMNAFSFPTVTDASFLQSVVLGFAVAASFIVPGIDSAAILTAFGLYELFVASVADLNFSVLLPAGIGLVLGVLVVSFSINKLLEKCYTSTFSALFGLFVSIIPRVLYEKCDHLIKIQPGTDKLLDIHVAFNGEMLIAVICLAVGFAVSLLFSNLEKLTENNKEV